MGFNRLFSNVTKLNLIKVKKDKTLFCHILIDFCHVSAFNIKRRIYAVYGRFVTSVTFVTGILKIILSEINHENLY